MSTNNVVVFITILKNIYINNINYIMYIFITTNALTLF